jgi:TRAP-type C4-dicarboxylate transport system permease small subunit
MEAKSGVLRALRALDGVIRVFERFVLMAAIILASVMLIAGVIARTVVQRSFTFTEEVAGFFIVSMTFIGIAYGARVGRHIRMSAVFDLLPIQAKKVMIIIINFITCAVLSILTVFAVQYFLRVQAMKVLSPALRYPRAILVGFAAFGLFLGAVEYLKNFIFNLLTVKAPDVYISTEKKDIGYDV